MNKNHVPYNVVNFVLHPAWSEGETDMKLLIVVVLVDLLYTYCLERRLLDATCIFIDEVPNAGCLVS